MHRLVVAAAAALGLLLATPALAGHDRPPVTADQRHVCVITNADRNEGYCVKTEGIDLPKLP